ncbi:putative repeat protein (TIGR01451 family) [Catenulispora sp. EB89]|uniref:Ig-like domain-containing protein n=1 Tax=Catenulispora sp. EB89 TaxID=3156257 RepID=UPI003519ACAB
MKLAPRPAGLGATAGPGAGAAAARLLRVVTSAALVVASTTAGFALGAAPALAAQVACTPTGSNTACVSFTYSGSDQAFVVPKGVSSLTVSASGAGGGGRNGAAGGLSTGTLAVSAGDSLTVMVGQAGTVKGAATYGAGGSGGSGSRFSGGSGGGMSALWTGASLTGTPLLVAGGGAGGAEGGSSGGSGGGASGANGGNPGSGGGSGGQGGSQSTGGPAAVTTNNCASGPTAGARYRGGNGGNGGADAGGGGGGGYFGGGGGQCQQDTGGTNSDTGGGGGSGYTGGAGVTDGSTQAGLGSAARTDGSVTLQWVAPAPVITGPAANSTQLISKPPISGTGVPGTTITVKEGSATLCTATVQPDNTWSCTPSSALANGSHSVVATATDPAAPSAVYPASNTQPFKVDTTTNLKIVKSAPDVLQAGDPITFTLTATNAGPAAAAGAVVQDTVDSQLTGVAWSCAATGGAVCATATGTGNAVSANVDIPVGGQIVITVKGNTSTSMKTQVLNNTATIAAAAGSTDPDLTDNRSTTATSVTAPKDACGYVPVNLVNGSFEQPVTSAGVTMVDDSTVPGWNTTASDHKIEIWRSGTNGVPSADGNQFVELNANEVSTLYQDIPTVPGTPMNWALSHRGRLGTDVMRLEIGPPGGSLIAQTPNGQNSTSISDGNTAWGHYTGSYTVPSGQTVTRFAFVSVSSTGGNNSIGNFLDNIVFGSPGCLKPTKTVADVQGNSPARRGDTLAYTISANNPGNTQTTGSYINDVIPANTAFVPGSIKLISPTGVATAVSDANGFVGGAIKVAVGTGGPPTAGGVVQPGETWKVSFQVTVNAAAPAGTTIANSATATWIPVPGTPAKTSDPAVATIKVEQADLAARKQASTTPVSPGQTFTYQITLTNNGPDQARNVKASDPLPSKVSFVSSPDGCTATAGNGGTVTCGPAASLAGGASKSWSITVKLDPSYTGDGTDQGNVATPSADTPGTMTPSGTVYPPGPITPTAALVATKTASTTPVKPGQTYTYTVTVRNDGPSTAVAVGMTDPLPSKVSFVSSADGCTGTAGNGGTVTCGPQATLLPGTSKSWTFTVKLDPSYTGNGSDQGNVATPTSTTGGTKTPSGQVLPPGPATPSADLLTTKETTTTTPVAPGQTFTYKVTVTNNGPSTAVAVGATDPLPSKISFVSSTDGCTAGAGNGATVTCGPEATLLPGASKSWTFTVKLDPSYTGNGSDQGNIATATSTTGGTKTPSDPVYPPGPVAPPNAHLTTTKTTSATPVKPGQTFTYTVTVSNQGPSTAVAAGSTDALPSKVSFVSSADGCTGTAGNGGTVTCGPEASLLPGASKSWTFTVKLDPSYTGDGKDQANVATATSPTDGTKDPSPPVDPPGPVTPEADLVTTKTTSTTPVKPGGTFTYTVTVQNNGPSTAVTVGATDTLPSQISFVSSADGCTGPVGANAATVTCGPEATLLPGASKSWTFTVKLDPSYTGDGTDQGNVATATSPTDGTKDPSGPPVNPPGPITPEADLKTVKTTSSTAVKPGQTFTYTVTVTNQGPSTAVTVGTKDTLPSQISFVSSADGCTGTAGNGGTVTCGTEPALLPGASKSWTFTVKLDASYTGDGKDQANVATATSPTDGTKDPSPPIDPPGPITPEADLATTKATSTTAVKPGQTFTYTVTVTNNGPSTAVSVGATDPLPSKVSFVSSADGCTGPVGTNGGTVSCGGGVTLLPGASKSWTFTVKLDPSYTGDGSDQGNVATATSPTDGKKDPSGPPVNPPGPITPEADLKTVKTTSSTAVKPGQTFTYTVTVTNQGPSTAVTVGTTDTLPSQISFVSSADGCTGTAGNGGTVTCGTEPALLPGASKSWTFTVKLDPSYTGDGTDQANVATATSPTDGTKDPSPPVDPPGPIKPEADLKLTKTTPSTTPVKPGQTFDYVLAVKNNGPSTAVNVGATDPLPSKLSFVSSVDGCTGPVGTNGGTVSCGGDVTLLPGETKTWTFTAKLDPSYTGDGSDQGNVATATSSTDGTKDPSDPKPPPGPVAPPEAHLTTVKSTSSAPVKPGQTFTYTVTVTNQGPSTAVNVGAADPLPSKISFVSSADGCTGTAGEGGTVTCGPEASLLPGASKSWTFTVLLDHAYTGDGSDQGNIATPTSPTGGEKDPSGLIEPPGPIMPEADLATAKSAVGTTPVKPGETFDYLVTTTNHGPSAAVNVNVADPLPKYLAFVSSADGCSGPAGTDGGLVSCGPLASLGGGASKSWTFTVRLDPAYTGDGSDLGNRATSKSDTTDPNPDDNTSPPAPPPAGKVDPPEADLSAHKETVTDTPVGPGQTFAYRVRITNAGPSTAVAVRAVDALPARLSFVSSADGCTAPAGVYGATVTCGPRAALAPGASVSWTFTVKLDPGYTGDGSDVLNTATAKSDTKDPDPGNDTSPPATVPGGKVAPAEADLSTAKTAHPPAGGVVRPGGTFRYTVTVTNHGPATAPNVRISDPLPTMLSFVSSPDGCTGPAGTPGGTVTCGPEAKLAPEASKSWTFTVRLAPTYKGNGSDIRNKATAASDAIDPNPGDNSNDPNDPGNRITVGALPPTGATGLWQTSTAALMALAAGGALAYGARRRGTAGTSRR